MSSAGKIRSAASLIINCAKPKSNSNYNYEILLLKRSSNMKFAPNRYVFPGGAYEHEHDASRKWLDVFCKNHSVGNNDYRKYFSNLLLADRGIKRPTLFMEPYDPKKYIPPELSYS
jgi:hypothetical protein